MFWAHRPPFSSWTWIAILMGVIPFLTVSPSSPTALATPPITSSGLNTQISVLVRKILGFSFGITPAVLAKRKFQAEEGSRVASRH